MGPADPASPAGGGGPGFQRGGGRTGFGTPLSKPLAEVPDLAEGGRIRVGFHDIDIHGPHQQTSRYLRWMIDRMEEGFLVNHQVRELEINFLAEGMMGDETRSSNLASGGNHGSCADPPVRRGRSEPDAESLGGETELNRRTTILKKLTAVGFSTKVGPVPQCWVSVSTSPRNVSITSFTPERPRRQKSGVSMSKTRPPGPRPPHHRNRFFEEDRCSGRQNPAPSSPELGVEAGGEELSEGVGKVIECQIRAVIVTFDRPHPRMPLLGFKSVTVGAVLSFQHHFRQLPGTELPGTPGSHQIRFEVENG